MEEGNNFLTPAAPGGENAVLAHQRGRGTIRWFLISLLISPPIITIVLALLGRTRQQVAANAAPRR